MASNAISKREKQKKDISSPSSLMLAADQHLNAAL
jgi:hypothetical protein